MSGIILHHYPLSPYSEKIRLLFGLKGVEWRSVEVPVMTPRPLLTPTIGGFRRIPILQIGADFYCDTLLISDVIEKMRPLPGLFPQDQLALIKPVCWWIEKSSYMNALCLAVGGMAGHVPDALVEERTAFFGFNLDPNRLLTQRRLYLQRLDAHLSWLEEILSDGRKFIFGNHPTAADLAAYHLIWFVRQNGGPEIAALLPALAASAWYDRVAAFGYGSASPMTAEAAIEIAREAIPEDINHWSGDAANIGLRMGDRVRVTADDYGKDPVVGRLLAWTADKVVIRHTEPSVGDVNLHFPRAGFDVQAA